MNTEKGFMAESWQVYQFEVIRALRPAQQLLFRLSDTLLFCPTVTLSLARACWYSRRFCGRLCCLQGHMEIIEHDLEEFIGEGDGNWSLLGVALFTNDSWLLHEVSRCATSVTGHKVRTVMRCVV